MGCCSDRESTAKALSESYAAAAEYTAAKYNETTVALAPHAEQAGKDYAPQIESAKI